MLCSIQGIYSWIILRWDSASISIRVDTDSRDAERCQSVSPVRSTLRVPVHAVVPSESQLAFVGQLHHKAAPHVETTPSVYKASVSPAFQVCKKKTCILLFEQQGADNCRLKRRSKWITFSQERRLHESVTAVSCNATTLSDNFNTPFNRTINRSHTPSLPVFDYDQ